MISALILAAALSGQVSASDGPPRQWVSGMVDGRAVWLWGWHENGWVKFYRHENGQVFNPPKVVVKPVMLPKPLPAGNVLEAGGVINSGLNLKDTHPTVNGGFETNDPKLADKLESRCPNDEPCPDPSPLDPDAPAKQEIPWLWVAVGCIIFLLAWNHEPNASK